jgi:hypothetical protein
MEIQKGLILKSIGDARSPQPSTHSDPVFDMLAEIKKGFILKPAGNRPAIQKPLTRQNSDALSNALRNALRTIKKASHSSGEDNDNDYDENEASGWQDDLQ